MRTSAGPRAGGDPTRAAREFAQEELTDHKYVMVLHDYQANPHVHIQRAGRVQTWEASESTQGNVRSCEGGVSRRKRRGKRREAAIATTTRCGCIKARDDCRLRMRQ